MALHIYEGLSGKLITTTLKPGRRSKQAETGNLLIKLIKYLRERWANTTIIVRGDSHFTSAILWTGVMMGTKFRTPDLISEYPQITVFMS